MKPTLRACAPTGGYWTARHAAERLEDRQLNTRAKSTDADSYADIARAGLEPLKTIGSRWPAIIGAVLTLAMIAGLGRELLGHGLAGLTRSVVRSGVTYGGHHDARLIERRSRPNETDFTCMHPAAPLLDRTATDDTACG